MHFFPQSCLVCHTTVLSELSICKPCENELPWQAPGCKYCGILLPRTGRPQSSALLCDKCAIALPAFDSCHALFEYCSPVQELIGAFKYRHQFVAGRLFAQLLAQSFKRYYEDKSLPELLVPVPLHTRRLRFRGFNQSLELTRYLGKSTSIPVDSRYCRRHQATPAQRGLNAGERIGNIRNAFALNSKHPYASICKVAIVDDVVTTTATVNELAHTLRMAGVQEIDVWALARVN